MSRKITIILAVGILLRLFLAATTYHADISVFHLAGRLIGSGNILNLYDYIGSLPESDPLTKIFPPGLFIYPPAIFLFFGLVPNLLVSLLPNTIHTAFTFDLVNLLGNIQLNVLLLLFKLPYLVFDLGIAFLLLKMFSSSREKLLAFSLWIFNPVNLYATYMMGQFDIIAVFFVILALYYFSQNYQKAKFIIPAALLGIGAMFKIFPLLFLVPLASAYKKFGIKVLVILLGTTVFFIPTAFYLNSPGFRSSALVAGQTVKSLYAQIPVSGGESIILFLAFLFFFYFLFWLKGTGRELWKSFFLVLLLFFIFTHYHPQWFLWLTPFLIIDLVDSRLKHWPLVLASLFSFFGLILFFDPGLSIGLFSPIAPSLYGTGSLWEIIGVSLDTSLARSILHTVFVGAGLFYLYTHVSVLAAKGKK